MKLSAFTVVDVDPGDPTPDPDRARRVVALAEVAERAGLQTLWVAEHHFEGGGVCPAPAVLLAACGARTDRLRLGSLVSVLPFHRPIDVAEEYALLDRLTGGRLNFGVGSGYLAGEFAGFGLDPSTKRARFEESLQTVLDAMSGDSVLATSAATERVRIGVQPVQRPHPPVWIAVQRREAVAHVGARGSGVALIPYATVKDVGELGDVIRDYRAALPAGTVGRVAAAVHVYAGPNTSSARAAFRRYLAGRLRTHSTFYEQKNRQDPGHATPEALEAADLAVFGEADEVVRRLGAYRDAGVDELLGVFDFGSLDEREVHRSVESLGAVWPSR